MSKAKSQLKLILGLNEEIELSRHDDEGIHSH